MEKKKKGKEMIPLINEENKSYPKQKVCYICKKEFSTDGNDKKYYKVRDHYHYTGKYRVTAHNIWNLRYKTPKEIPVVFHNISKYDYYAISKEQAEECKGKFVRLGENTEKYKTFLVPINKELENIKIITYKIKFIESFTFMSNSLSSILDNPSEGLHNNKCKNCKSCLEYISTEDKLLIFNCLKCSQNYKKHFHKYLIKKFANTYKLCDVDINKLCLMLRKGVYP